MLNDGSGRSKTNTIIKKIKDKSAPVLRFGGNNQLQKGVILFFFSFILAALLIPQTHFKYPQYKIGAIATTDIKANRNFLVENSSATEHKRLEAIKNVQSVYDYDSGVNLQIQINLTNVFSLMRELIAERNKSIIANASKDTKSHLLNLKKTFESSIGISLSTDEFNILNQYKFSSSILNEIKNLLTTAYNEGIITNVTFMQIEKGKGIIIRDFKDQTERELKDLSQIRHIKDVEISLKNAIGKTTGHENKGIRRVALTLSVKLMQPNLAYNKNETELRKQEAYTNVKPIFIEVQKNEMLVREGEQITGTVMDKLKAYYKVKEGKRLSNFFVFIGAFFTIGFLAIILYFPLKNWLKLTIADLLFLCVITILQVIIVKAGVFVAEAITDAFPFLPAEALTYPIPFTVGSMLVSLLINRHLALVLSIFLSVIITFLFDGKIGLFLFSFLGSVVASYQIVDCRQRTAFFKVGFILGIVNMAAIILLRLLNNDVPNIDTLIIILMGFAGGLVSGIIAAGLTPLFEALFHYTTDIRLLELANLNQPIFQRMIIEAPGTYHHSIIVASMVEAAAEAIKANSLLAKVSAYYHDIGKMTKPQYFIENQQNGENKHDKLSPKMSSLVIISHVKDGCELAGKLKLGPKLTNIIREHHGTSMVSFFYEKAKKDKDPSIRSLPESDFRYPGPKPQIREAGLVLLGDIVEASSRSLSNPTPSRIKTLVRERINGVFSDGQLDECELTLRDLNRIAESFNLILNGIFHHRIDYPEITAREVANGNRNNRKENNDYIDRKPAEKNKAFSTTVAAVGE